ncbi:FtsX-like permease family protein [bacterium]|nr:FtsX-like permease family protein [bacterium]
MIWFKLGWRNLWRNKRRTILELVSIGGSVFIAVWWNNLAIGSYAKMVDDGVRMGSGHIGIYHNKYLELRKTEQVIEVSNLVAELEREPEVTNVFPRLKVPGLIRSSRESRAAGFMGIDFDREKGINPVLEPKRIVEGKLPGKDDPRGILIGEGLAHELGLNVGNKCVFMVQGPKGEIVSALLRISGLVRTNIREIDAGAVFIDREKLADIIGYKDSAHEIAVMLRSNKMVKQMLPRIREIAARYPNAEAYQWEDAMPELASSIHMDHAGLQITVIIIYIIVGIGTINTLLMSVMERTREFGVIRAIGVSKSGIRKMVLSEAFVLSCVGVLSGYVLSSIAGLYTATKGINLTSVIDEQGIGGTLYEPIMYSTWDVKGMLIMGVGMICIALLASLYPAHHVMKIRPSDAMRIY